MDGKSRLPELTRAHAPPLRRRSLDLLVVNWLEPDNPAAGGAERHLAETFGRLTSRGRRILVVASGFAGGRRVARHRGLIIVRAGGALSFFLVARAVIRRLVRRYRVATVVEDLKKVPLFLGRVARRPAVVPVHHWWRGSAFRATPFRLALLAWLGERGISAGYRTARFVAVSPSTGRDLVTLGIDPERVSVVQNAASGTRSRVAVPKEPIPTFLYLGRLQRYKRVHRLIEATRQLEREGLPVQVRIALASRGHHQRRATGRAIVFRRSAGHDSFRRARRDEAAGAAPTLGDARGQSWTRSAGTTSRRSSSGSGGCSRSSRFPKRGSRPTGSPWTLDPRSE